MSQIPPFFVGQEVVCVKDQSQGLIKKGQEFTVRSIRRGCCNKWVICVGLKNYIGYAACSICKRVYESYTMQFNSILFAPKDPFTAISFTKVIEEELTSVN